MSAKVTLGLHNVMVGTIKPCNFCKVEYPATTEHFHKSNTGKYGLSGKCKACYKQYKKDNREKIYLKDRRYREKNNTKVKAVKRAWREAHKEHIQNKSKTYYKENKERILTYQKGYVEQNNENVLMRAKAWRIENKERLRALYHAGKERRYANFKRWCSNNKEAVVRLAQVRRARVQSLVSDFTAEQWESCKYHFEQQCAYCGSHDKLTQEHFTPVTHGGGYSASNIIPACQSCNSCKHNSSFTEWYPTYKHYSVEREQKILKYLGYNKTPAL